MSDRYFARVSQVLDDYTIVINAGAEQNVMPGMKFLVITLGDLIIDPETKEELERLEIVRGRAEATHVQSKVATLKSIELEKGQESREIRKISRMNTLATIFNGGNEVTEVITPSAPTLRKLALVNVGDLVIKL